MIADSNVSPVYRGISHPPPAGSSSSRNKSTNQKRRGAAASAPKGGDDQVLDHDSDDDLVMDLTRKSSKPIVRHGGNPLDKEAGEPSWRKFVKRKQASNRAGGEEDVEIIS